ncbi:hypothetical protein HDU79_006596 [Rhizoclosmatium sp. JEL0117]|nr:hypothetical protein HDU79_006596 [Rhizoclosmatium sp. JEL0117]
MQRPSTSSSATATKITRPKCSISILFVVVIQTFVVALVVLLVPLLLSVNNTRTSNSLSVQTGRDISSNLVSTIQYDANKMAATEVDTWLSYFEETINNFQLAIFNGYVDPYSIDDVYDYFRMIEQRNQKIDSIFMGFVDTSFLLVRGDTPNRVGLVLNKETTGCRLCTLLFPENSTNPILVARKTSRNTLVRYKVLDFTVWNAINTSSPLDSLTLDYKTRPFYVAAMKQSQENAVVQWTSPYFVAGANYTGVGAGLPLYTRNGTLVGVVGVDLTYMNMASYVAGYKPTPNSFMFIMTGTGVMIVSSFNETLGNSTTKILKSLVNCTTPILVQISNYLSTILLPNQTYESLGPSAHYEIGNMYVQLSVTKRNMIIISGALKSDYQGDYDVIIDRLETTLSTKLNQMIVIGIGLFVFVMLLGVVFTYLQITKPMQKLATYLEMASNFKFKPITESGGYGKTSFLSELGEIHVMFFEMVERFAVAIKENHEFAKFSNGPGGYTTVVEKRRSAGDVRNTVVLPGNEVKFSLSRKSSRILSKEKE